MGLYDNDDDDAGETWDPEPEWPDDDEEDDDDGLEDDDDDDDESEDDDAQDVLRANHARITGRIHGHNVGPVSQCQSL